MATATKSHPPTSKPGRGPYIGKLSNIEGIRREICRVYKLARQAQIGTLDAHRLAGILHLAARLIEGQELEKRIEALEQQKGA